MWPNPNGSDENQLQGALLSVLTNYREFGDAQGAPDEEWEQIVPMLPAGREVAP